MQVYGKTMILSGADLEEASIKLLKAHQMDPTPASATQIIKCQLLRSVQSPVKSLGVRRRRDRSLTHIFLSLSIFALLPTAKSGRALIVCWLFFNPLSRLRLTKAQKTNR
jgi:hypothetical protein